MRNTVSRSSVECVPRDFSLASGKPLENMSAIDSGVLTEV